ncbi:hypothetical protein Bca52824_024122 [Brassica carinata]|uniref:Uncharacterized protein n=1 Tax=Brassica carinata TaxID=52824 RepID=A0A8X8AU23_BRACI|nr:hypothetical protein Bca52824_024122 [Brassica carinata]
MGSLKIILWSIRTHTFNLRDFLLPRLFSDACTSSSPNSVLFFSINDDVKYFITCEETRSRRIKTKNEAETIQENNNPRKEVFVIKHQRSHERSKTTTTDPEDSAASEEKSTGTTTNQTPDDVEAILIQCGRLSQSNSAAAAKPRRYSGSKRSFDFDKNGDADEADAEDGGEEEEAKLRIHRQQQRGGGESPWERRRRTPSRERDSFRFLRRIKGTIKRVAVKRNVASPTSQSPARAASPRAQSPARVNTSSNAQPSPSKLRRKTEHSPYRRNPLGEIDPNSLAYPQPHHGNTNSNKKMMNRDNEYANLEVWKMNAKTGTQTQAPIHRSASPSRVTKEQQEAVEECKMTVCFALIVVRMRCTIKGRRKWLSIFYLVYGLKPEEISGIDSCFAEYGTLAATGLFIGGTKYILIQGETNAVTQGKR